MQIRYLKSIKLNKSTRVKQDNGTYINEYILVNNYKVQMQELNDEVSANVYGANINKTYRILSPQKELEKFCQTKVSDEEDNISKYLIEIDESKYKVVSVKKNWLDIQLI